MTLNELASLIAKTEGKKSQAKIGDIREILKILVEIEMMAVSLDNLETKPSVVIHWAALARLTRLRILEMKRTKRKKFTKKS